MDDKKRKKILWLSIILIVIMAVLFLVLKLSDREPVEVPVPEDLVKDQPVFEPKSVDLQYEEEAEIIKNDPPESNTEFTVLNLAKSYASRLGSWSTDNPGKNLQELLTLSTASMKNYLNTRDLGTGDVEYFGITSKSLSAELISLSGNQAEVSVKTQRVETDANLLENLYYQDIEVTLLKSGDQWLVSEAYWIE